MFRQLQEGNWTTSCAQEKLQPAPNHTNGWSGTRTERLYLGLLCDFCQLRDKSSSVDRLLALNFTSAVGAQPTQDVRLWDLRFVSAGSACESIAAEAEQQHNQPDPALHGRILGPVIT